MDKFTIYMCIIITALVLLLIFMFEWKSDKKNIFLTLFINNIKIEGDITMLSMTATQFVEGRLNVVDRLGNPAQVEPGSIQIVSNDETVCIIQRIGEDETAFKVVATGDGVTQVDFSADADLGDGVTTITGYTGVEIIPAQAVGFGVTFGEPQEQTA